MRLLQKRKLLAVLLLVIFVLIGLHLRIGYSTESSDTIHSQGSRLNAKDVDRYVHIYPMLPLSHLDQNILPSKKNDHSSITKPFNVSVDSLLNGSDLDISIPTLPGLVNYLPHLKDRPELIVPDLRISAGRRNVTFVIGVPSIMRPVDSYIINTLTSLITGMNATERDETLIIVCITEPWNKTYANKIIGDLKQTFPTEISQGLLEVIMPQAGYYPDLNSLKPSLGDSPTRVRWRSKQNLDYAFLMLHAWNRGKYYIQLEDDIQATPGYVTGMKQGILNNFGDWFLLQFSTLGFIGRLFKSTDVPKVLEFLLMFFSSKPCDWLLEDFLRVKVCGHGDKWSLCIHKIKSIARILTPSLFQHEGLHSSFAGNLNKLKDKSFGSDGQKIFINPPLAGVITTLQVYSNHDIYSVYNGDDIFWATFPKEGDIIDFIFDHSIRLTKILIQSGDKNQGDIFKDTTVEILPEKFVIDGDMTRTNRTLSDQENQANINRKNYVPQLKTVNETFHTLGVFDMSGHFTFDVPEKFGRVWILRLCMHSNSQTWVIINKVCLILKSLNT
ncbi:unnamed protein product [Lymnaea stagnalis]|uniref:Alpha-1,3-mannosyl-glycoprotein 4-beta-N-acetylglucosaminyltransferase A n=1 Tax=Lymnaea stagnalis TaxID=6523 RepID=A0AAV2IJL0_LYMST